MNFRPELHVAQQSRRYKLRNHPHHPHHHLNPYNNNIHDHHPLPSVGMSFDDGDDPSDFCSGIPTTHTNYNHLSDPHFGTWESIASQTDPDHNGWVSVARHNDTNYRNTSYVAEGMSVNPTLSALEVKSYNDNDNNNNNNELYHNALQELVSTSAVRSSEAHHWNGGGGELLLLPAYTDQIGCSRPVETHQWNGEQHSNTQALSLSLSSVPSPKVHATQIAERNNAMDFHSRDIATRQDVIGAQAAVLTHRTPGPLGPFTGYATILRGSRFLRPAQILLEELCCVARPKNLDICDQPDKMLEEFRVSGEGVCSGDLSSSFSIGFNERSRDVGCASGWLDSCRPESLHKKAKLLYMQDEVSKKYKQYQQQMQMVVSSFESVEGLGASTPYVSLALKMVSKHFRCLKNAITDQLKSIRNALGEELMSPSGCTSGSKGDGRASMLKFFDQSIQKQKGTSNNSNDTGILDGQHIWRPQRGLPERAVSILRAWLFDHFLHPYPTDTDKHMLATQTGLTRNQVSNWFINARVRVWKPMVEEIHMLETKGMEEACSDGKTTNMSTDCDQPNNAGQCSNTNQTSGKYSSVDYPISTSWNQEKRSRIEYGIPTGVMNDGSLMGLMPAAHQTVSLTLGLRQSAENGQRPQHYGGQFRRDFVG